MNKKHLLNLIAAAFMLSAGIASADDSLIVTLPGQTYFSGGGNGGTVTAQTVGTPFAIKLEAVGSDGVTIDTSFAGTVTVSYSGPTGGAAYVTTVSFTAGTNTTTLNTTLVDAQTTTISATATGAMTPIASSSLLVKPKLIVTLPGQTFTPGSGNSGSVSGQIAGVPFNIVSLTAVNSDNTIDTAFTGGQTVSYSGPANSPNGTVPSYTTSASFTAGQATALATTLSDVQTTTITPSIAGVATGVASSSLTVAANTAMQLAFTTSTGGGLAGLAFKAQPAVTIEDANGNAVTGTPQNVTLALQNNPAGGTLSGTTMVAVNTSTGVAAFSNLSINNVGVGYTLTAMGNTLDTSAGALISPAFNIITSNAYTALVLSDGAYACWPLQEASGANIYDIAGTNNGIMMVSTDVNNDGLGHDYETAFVNVGLGSSDGKSYSMGGSGFLYGVTNDAAIYFTNLNGQMVGSQIVVPYNSNMDVASNFTAEGWVHLPIYPIGYSSTNFNDQTIFGLEANSGSQSGWYFNVSTDGTGASAGRLNGNLAHGNHSGFTASTITSNYMGTWVYMAMTYDTATFKVYENSNLLATFNNPTYGNVATLSTHIEPFIIGSYCQSYFGGSGSTGNERARFFHGGVSHIAFYTNVLTAAQILNHYLTAIGPVSPPVIGTQPVGGTNYIAYSRTLSVVAAGTAPLHYQWYKNTLPIAGQTNASLVLSNLVLTNAGNYYVNITNTLGGTNSDTVSVGVLSIPTNPYQAAIVSEFPQAYYPLNETSGTLAQDIIQTGDNNGTYVTEDTNVPPLLPLLGQPGASSILGTSVTFDPTVTNGIVIPDLAAMGIVGNLTLEAWVLVQDTTSIQWIVAHSPAIEQNPSKTADFLAINGGYYVVERYQQSIVSMPDFGTTYPIPSEDMGNWVYLVGVADGTAWRLYRNGVEVSEIADTNIPPGAIAANGGWSIGARNGNSMPPSVITPLGGTSLNGSINNVAIYDYALSPDTILAHYQIGLPRPKLTIQQSGTNVIVSWPSGFLQEATSPTGPWTYDDTNTVSSPYTVGQTNAGTFFRTTSVPPSQ